MTGDTSILDRTQAKLRFILGGPMVNISANNSTIVYSSLVSNAFNVLKERSVDQQAAFDKIRAFVESSANAEAREIFAEFSNEVAKPQPRKPLLKAYWDGLVSYLPDIVTLAESASKLISLFGKIATGVVTAAYRGGRGLYMTTKSIPAPSARATLAASPRQTRGRDERLARGRSGYPGRRISAEDEAGVDDCRRAELVRCWTFLPALPGQARPRVPPSRMAWAAAAPTARRQASSASARRARRRHPSQKAQWGTPVAASAQQTRSRRRGSVSPNADYPLRDGASPMPAFPAGSAKHSPGRAGCAVLGGCLPVRFHRHPRA